MLFSPFGKMGTLPRLFVLAGVFGFVVSQDVFRMVQQPPGWFHVGEEAEVHCKWELSSGNYSNEVLEWKTKGIGIKKETKDNPSSTFVYKNSPISEERMDVTVDWEGYPEGADLIVQSSILSFTNFHVTDPHNYTCEVEVGQAQVSIVNSINPYAIPSVSMQDNVIMADLRKPVEPSKPDYPDYPGYDVNGTDLDTVGEADPAVNGEAVPSRRRRQAGPFATVDENPVTDTNATKYISVSCDIIGAYPKPTNIVFIVGERDRMEPSGDVEWSVDDTTKLFSGTAVLEMEADPMYDGKSVTCSVTIPTQPARTLESSNASTPFEILHEATEVKTILRPEIATEGATVTIECRGNGNPAPTFSIESDHPDMSFEADATGTKFTITSVTREQEGYYWCQASSVDRSNPTVPIVVKSEERRYLEVQYIDSPTLSTTAVTGSKGDSRQVTCTAKGNPPPVVTWTKNGNSYSSGSVLSLSSLQYSDSGTYECVTENDAGTRTASVSVKVEGKCNIDFQQPLVTSSKTKEATYLIRLTCVTNGNPECQVNIVPPKGFDAKAKSPVRSGGTVTLEYPSVPKLIAPVVFTCVASNPLTPRYNRTVTVGESSAACCASPQKSGISTGAIVGILLLVLVVIIGIPVACYCVKKRNAPSKKAPGDAEAGPAEKEGLNKEASSEDSDTGSLPPPPPADNTDPRMNSSHEMTTFSTNQ